MTEAPQDDNDPTTEQDPDADPGQLHPRDERGVESGDGVAEDDGTDADGDPEQLNPPPDAAPAEEEVRRACAWTSRPNDA